MRPVPELINRRPGQLSEQVVLLDEGLKLFVYRLNDILVEALHKLHRFDLGHYSEVIHLRLVAEIHLNLLRVELFLHNLLHILKRKTAASLQPRHMTAASLVFADNFLYVTGTHGETFLGLFTTAVTCVITAVFMSKCLDFT